MNIIKITAACIILFAIIIVSGIFISLNLSDSSKRLEGYLSDIESNVSSQNWEKAKYELSNMKKDWSKTGKGWSIMIDHYEIDNIDNSVSRLSIFIQSKDPIQTLAETATLKQYIKHIPDKEKLNIKNIL